jgi:lactoylglutathione lyase
MGAFRITRDLFDIGLFSDNPAMPQFYEHELGLPYVDVLQHSPTYQERFYEVNGASLKINYSIEPMQPGSSGYRGLLIARDDVATPQTVTDPDGLEITLVPRGAPGASTLGVRVAVADVDRQRDFLVDALDATEDGEDLVVGSTRFLVERATGATTPTPTWRRGFNYVLIAVDDAAAAHDALIAAGAVHGMRPIRLADRCVFSWVRDPNGNWVEIVQYAADTGELPDIPRADQLWPQITAWRVDGTPY